MRKLSTRRASKPVAASTEAVTVTSNDVADVNTVITEAAPVAASKPAKPEPTPAELAAARTNRRVAVDARTIMRYATHFASASSRDDAYLCFFGLVSLASAPDGAVLDSTSEFTLAAAHTFAGGINPLYIGSNKATDAGAVNRLRKAGHIVADDAGRVYTFTASGADAANALISKHRKLAVAAELANSVGAAIAG